MIHSAAHEFGVNKTSADLHVSSGGATSVSVSHTDDDTCVIAPNRSESPAEGAEQEELAEI